MLQNWANKKVNSLLPNFNVAVAMKIKDVKSVEKKNLLTDQFLKSRWKSFIHGKGLSNTLHSAQGQSFESSQDNSILEPSKTSQNILTQFSFPHSSTEMVRTQSQGPLLFVFLPRQTAEIIFLFCHHFISSVSP